MGTKKITAEIVREWERIRQRQLESGLSMERSCVYLGQLYSCAPTTVRRALDPAYAEIVRRSDRESHTRLYWKRKRRQDYQRMYQRNHSRLTSPTIQPKLFSRVFESGVPLTLDELTDRLREQLEGVQFRSRTIERLLRSYETGQHEGRIRGPPYLTESEPGIWRYALTPPGTADEPLNR